MAYKVIIPVAVEPLSLEETRLHLKLTDDDTTVEDALIEAWISAARELAEHYTGRALAEQTLETALEEFPDDDECESIALDVSPVRSITSIKYTDTAGAEQTLSTSAYSLSTYGLSREIVPAYATPWPVTRDVPDAVRIRYVAGFEEPPQAVRAALLLMVGWLFEHRGSEMDPDDIQPPAAKSLLNTVKVWSR